MEGERAEGGTFAQALAALKRRGGTVLVRAASTVDDPVCESLLGDDAAGRRRLLLEGDRDRRHAGRPPAGGVVRVAVPDGGRRAASTVAAAGAPGRPAVATTTPAPADLVGLVSSVREGIETLGGEDLEPGQLRVCGGDLVPLLTEFGLVAVRRYLRLVAARVVDVGGLAHFHLPDTTGVEPSILPPFDVHIDVRRRPDGVREQRWRLRDSGHETDWLPLVVE